MYVLYHLLEMLKTVLNYYKDTNTFNIDISLMNICFIRRKQFFKNKIEKNVTYEMT